MGQGEYCLCGCRWDVHHQYFEDSEYMLGRCNDCTCERFDGDMNSE